MKAWKTAAALLVAILMSGTARAGWDPFAGGGEAREKAKEKQSERVERETDLYQDGMDAIDDEDWDQAVRFFSKCAEMKGKRAGSASVPRKSTTKKSS